MNEPEFWMQFMFLAGGACGLAAGWACTKSWDTSSVDKAKADSDYWRVEGERLRAQVARLVGDAPHGVKSITEAERLPTSAGNTPPPDRLAA